MNDLKVCSHEIESLSGAYYDEILKIRRGYYRLVRDVIIENIPGSGSIDANLAALFLFGSLNWMYMWYNRQRNPDLEGLSNQLLKIFLEGMKAT